MKCPHCEYVDGWCPEILEIVDGDKGHFYEMTNDVVMSRRAECSYGEVRRGAERVAVYGCPSCQKVFINP